MRKSVGFIPVSTPLPLLVRLIGVSLLMGTVCASPREDPRVDVHPPTENI